jgi:Putative prokaryotic signal transducing protein
MGVTGWTVVYKGERFQAEIIAAALVAEGLRAEVFGDSAYGVGINLTEARLMVPDGEAEAARRVIRQAESAPADEADEAD